MRPAQRPTNDPGARDEAATPAQTALVALGSNLAPRRAQLDSAVRALADLPHTELLRVSSWIETDPVDAPPGSAAFLNGAALLHTRLRPHALLRALQAIEAAHGRRRVERNGPRTLDLDLILHGTQILDDAELTLPHPRAHERLFVLEPAVEVAPDLVHPVLRQSLAAWLASVRADAPPLLS